MSQRNSLCWCGSGRKWKNCHYPEISNQSPTFEQLKRTYAAKYKIFLKTAEEIEGIKAACRITAQILDALCRYAKIGMTTLELERYAYKLHQEAGVIPAPLNYGHPPFPRCICISLNDVICHGIADETPFKEGDIANIDVSCIHNGFYGDCSRMVVFGKTSPERENVVNVAYECLMRSIAILKPGIPIFKIGETIEDYAKSKGCSVVHQFVGHGVGLHFHENPQIPHCYNHNEIKLVPGMTFTIEPMINEGVADAVIDSYDQWTATTKDGKASAQWEHTLLITQEGHEILTPWIR